MRQFQITTTDAEGKLVARAIESSNEVQDKSPECLSEVLHGAYLERLTIENVDGTKTVYEVMPS